MPYLVVGRAENFLDLGFVALKVGAVFVELDYDVGVWVHVDVGVDGGGAGGPC